MIAGQGTAALELLEQAGPLDAVIAPVGGGGLISGTALAVKGRSPATRVIGAEPANADDARRSLEKGSIQPSNDPRTIADGLRTSLGVKTFAVISRHVDEIVTASEAEIIDATRFIWERLKIIMEPSSAVVVAPLLGRHLSLAQPSASRDSQPAATSTSSAVLPGLRGEAGSTEARLTASQPPDQSSILISAREGTRPQASGTLPPSRSMRREPSV